MEKELKYEPIDEQEQLEYYKSMCSYFKCLSDEIEQKIELSRHQKTMDNLRYTDHQRISIA